MRLTKRCEHGLKASVQLALHEQDGYLQAKQIAAREDLPGKFIESILSSLRESSLLISKVGARGGYRLARPASQIAVAQIISALEIDQDDSLALTTPTPGAAAMHFLQQRINNAIEQTFGSLTLEELAREQSVATPTRQVEAKPYTSRTRQPQPAATNSRQSENPLPRLVLRTDCEEPASV